MILQTSKGIEFELDLEIEPQYKTSRAIIQMLSDTEGFKVFESDDMALNQLVSDIDTLNLCTTEELLEVCKHYYKLLKVKRDNEEIDSIDFDILIGKLVIDELNNRWS